MFRLWPKQHEAVPEIPSVGDLESVFRLDSAVVFKHSPTCMVSLMAYTQVMRFRDQHPEVPVYLVSVRKERALSQRIAQKTGVHHASPQILVLQNGIVSSVASHNHITADHLARMLNIRST